MSQEEFRELTIITKMETVIDQVYPNLRNWPKFEKFGLSQTVRNELTAFVKYMYMANKVRSKRMIYSQEADAILASVKVNLRIAFKQKYISPGFHDAISNSLTEIGKLLTSYIRNISFIPKNKKILDTVSIDK